MRALTTIGIAALAAMVLATGARATDFVTYEAPTIEPVTPVYEEPAFDWNGFYAGAIVGWYTEPGDTAFTFGKAVGVNFTAGNILYGVEFNLLQYNFVPSYWEAVGRTRLGLLVNDNLLVYKTLGVGYYNNGAGDYGTYIAAGGGVEYALGRHFSVRGEYHAEIFPGFCCGHDFQLGLLWHLN